jgi:hypothetical protein
MNTVTSGNYVVIVVFVSNADINVLSTFSFNFLTVDIKIGFKPSNNNILIPDRYIGHIKQVYSAMAEIWAIFS